MIRVLNIISDADVGGAGRALLNYLRYADRTRFETIVAVPRGSLLKPELEKLGVKACEVNGIADHSYDREEVAMLRRLIRKVKPDIVHTHGVFSGRVAGRREGKAVFYTRYNLSRMPDYLRYPPGCWINKLISEHYADGIIAVSPAAAEELTDVGISEDLISVIMSGVAPAARASLADCAIMRQRWGIRDGDFVMGMLTPIEEHQGHMYVLKAASQLKQTGRQFRLLVAGAGSYEPEVRAEVIRRGLEREVILMGPQNDAAPILSILDVQLNAACDTGATSLSLLEGMSLGVPAIVSNYGGNPWIIEHGRTGLVFPNCDASGLARTILRVMDDRALLRFMGESAAKTYQTRFTGEIFARNIEQFYLDTLEEIGYERE